MNPMSSFSSYSIWSSGAGEGVPKVVSSSQMFRHTSMRSACLYDMSSLLLLRTSKSKNWFELPSDRTEPFDRSFLVLDAMFRMGCVGENRKSTIVGSDSSYFVTRTVESWEFVSSCCSPMDSEEELKPSWWSSLLERICLLE